MATEIISNRSLEQVLVEGDLGRLSPQDRLLYYTNICESLGLNALTKPLDYIKLNGKMTLYAKRDCTDQLRKINGVSVSIVAREISEGCYNVIARATDRTGRSDESMGSVPIGNAKGELLSNAMMKAETKAKRRVTLSLCGMGFLDETELSSIADFSPNNPKIDDDIKTLKEGKNNGKKSSKLEEDFIPEFEDSGNSVHNISLRVKHFINEGKIEEAYGLCESLSHVKRKSELWSLLDPKERELLKQVKDKEKETNVSIN